MRSAAHRDGRVFERRFEERESSVKVGKLLPLILPLSTPEICLYLQIKWLKGPGKQALLFLPLYPFAALTWKMVDPSGQQDSVLSLLECRSSGTGGLPCPVWHMGERGRKDKVLWDDVKLKVGLKGKKGEGMKKEERQKDKTSTRPTICRGCAVLCSACPAQVMVQPLLTDSLCTGRSIFGELWPHVQIRTFRHLRVASFHKTGWNSSSVWVLLGCSVSCCNLLSLLSLLQVVWAVCDAVAGWKWRCFFRIPAWCSGER